jgi:hypothetical protein
LRGHPACLAAGGEHLLVQRIVAPPPPAVHPLMQSAQPRDVRGERLTQPLTLLVQCMHWNPPDPSRGAA